MTIFDISKKLSSGMAVWPGDCEYRLERTLEIERGHAVNLTTITMSAHTGTHIDSPLHFTRGGQAVDELNLESYWGLAQVVTVAKPSGALFPDDFAAYDLSLAGRLLVRSSLSVQGADVFPQNYVYPSPALAEYLGRCGICLYGSDGPSMDAFDSKTLEGHHALHQQNIAILEWLDLNQVPDGIYEVVALPLNIMGGDGSPVRAVLRTVE